MQELLWLLRMHFEAVLVFVGVISLRDGAFGHWKFVFTGLMHLELVWSLMYGHQSALLQYSRHWSYCSATSCASPLGESNLELLVPSLQG